MAEQDTLTIKSGQHRVTIKLDDLNYRVPSLSEFGPPDDEEDYMPASGLRVIAQRLIADCPELGHLSTLEVAYLWKREGGESHGQARFGACQKASGLVKHFSEAVWVIWLAADHARIMFLTSQQVEAALYHELLHAGQKMTDKGEMVNAIQDHDVEMFHREVERYGAWRSNLTDAARTFRQLELFTQTAEPLAQMTQDSPLRPHDPLPATAA
ncbi:MAG: putative metallopeptidase [Pseudomonadota bacterium]